MFCKKAFTLVELLVVIAIITILAALLLPTLEKAMFEARKMDCAGRQRQIGLGCSYYQDDFRDWLLVFNNGFIPVVGDDLGYPKYWFDLWPTEARFCPTVRRSSEPGVGGQPMVDGSFDKYLVFGYQFDGANQWTVNRLFAHAGNDCNGDNAIEFVRPNAEGFASNIDSATGEILTRVFYGRKWWSKDTVPLLSDTIFQNTGLSRYCIAHSGSIAKRSTWIDPQGGNNLWYDGHVEWHQWGGNFSLDPRSRSSGFSSASPEGWTLDQNWWFWGRRSKHIE